MKNLIKNIFALLSIGILLLASHNTIAQLQCGTTEKTFEMYKNHPELLAKQIENDNLINDFLAQHPTGEKTRAGNYVIPIVFHIIHAYGNEDITDAQVYDAVRILNNDYNKLNYDTSAVVASFQNNIANIGFEFRLARIDPNGNCTNGIDRIYNYTTTNAGDKSKINPWDKSKYFNVWVVASAPASASWAGYAYMPGQQTIYDGVIILSNYIGSNGTGNVQLSRALTHEIGHCFNLAHTWGSTNQPGVSCGDDQVSDTPLTKGHSSCTVNDLASAVCSAPIIENTQNYMEYSYCSNMFTNGQKARMIATITNNIGNRGNLVSASNLIATGVSTTLPPCLPQPDFKPSRWFSCLGNNVTFTNKSNGDTVALNYNWNISGSNISNSTLTNVSATFNAVGWQSVGLTATSVNGTNTKTKNNLIYVSDPADTKPEGTYQDFENSTNNMLWPLFNIYENYFKFSIVPNGRNGGSCIKYNSFDDRTDKSTSPPYGDYDEMISPAYNIVNSTNCKISFWTSAAYNGNNHQDTLADVFDVLYSTNCGVSWKTLYTLADSNNLFNVGSKTTAFTPTTASQWVNHQITLPTGALTNSTYFKFRYKPSNASSNFYLDDILVSPYPLAITNVASPQLSFEVYPNPSNNGKVNLNLVSTEKLNVQITDITGRLIYSISENEIQQNNGQIQINTNWANGLYLVNVYSGNKKIESKKMVVNN